MAASFVLIYLVSFALYLLDAPAAAYWAASAAFLFLGCISWRQLRIFVRRSRSRSALLAFIALLFWDFLHLALVRHWGGGGWGGDWNEHYDRTRFFLHELPNNFLFLNRYLLPARPPLMNVLAAFYVKQVGTSYEAVSLVFMFLNAFAFLPCCLLLGQFGKESSRATPILLILFMLNPSIMENATFTWTKAFTAAFVVLGVCYYLRGLRHRSSARLLFASVCFAAAILIHYSAIPFVVAVVIHYLWQIAKNRRPSSEPLPLAAAAVALLATYFLWSISLYGLGVTFFSNTAAAGAAPETFAQTLQKLLYNCFTSIVPHPLHPHPPIWFDSLRSWSDVRDYFFLMSQTTLPKMIGTAGGWVVLLLLIRFFASRGPHLRGKKHFWLLFLVVGFLLGTAANPAPEPFGAAHVTLQPLALIGVTFLAANLRQIHPVLFLCIVLGTIVDYSLGVFLNFDLRSHIFPPIGDEQLWLQRLLNNDLGVDGQQYGVKLLLKLTFWGDHLAAIAGFLKAASIAIAAFALACLIRLRARKKL
jgi:hypothetical protein